MRLEKVAVLAALFLSSASFAQTGSAPPEGMAPVPPSGATPRIVRSTLPHELGLPPSESESSAPISPVLQQAMATGSFGTSPGYFRFDFLYMEFTDPSENGRILRTSSTDTSSRLIGNGFTTGAPNTDAEAGFRTTFGRWVSENVAFEIGGHWVHPYTYPVAFRADTRTSNSNGTQTTITDTVTFTPDNAANLSLAVLLYEIRNSGVELNMRTLLSADDCWTWEGILGFRYIEHDEIFHSFIQPTGGAETREIFQTENSIVGPQFGLEGRYKFHDYTSFKAGLKVGATVNAEDVNIGGPPVGTGRLTGQFNLGSRNSLDFCPFVDFTAGLVFDLTPNIHVHCGFDALYMDNVLRAMDQLDLRNVAARNVHYSFNRDSIMMYGVWIGTEFNF